MDVGRALSQIEEIHQQMAKAEVYRGYRSVPVAASGLIGFLAAALQPRWVAAGDPLGFVVYWCVVAAVAGSIGASEIVYNYAAREDESHRRRTRMVVGQFLPAVLAAAAISACFVRLGVELVPVLPGLWAICFGMGVLASRPYLPGASGYVALFYYAAGVALLWRAYGVESLSGWWVGGTFGAGQLFAALVLYWNLERREEEDAESYGHE
jgi:uncharacterized membrane protein HdeD (DUF308 family)